MARNYDMWINQYKHYLKLAKDKNETKEMRAAFKSRALELKNLLISERNEMLKIAKQIEKVTSKMR